MLSLYNVDIHVQNLGTIFGVFLCGKDTTAIQERYYSFYNYKATGGELEWWTDSCALFWIYSTKEISAEKKFRRALTQAALSEILQSGKAVKGKDCWPEANRIAEERWSSIEWVNWFQSKVDNLEIYDMGHKIAAECGTGNFNDDVLGSVIEQGKSSLGIIQAKYISTDEKGESETVCVEGLSSLGVS